jgi:hypothetical protein
VSEHGWPGWADDPAGHGGPDPHDGGDAGEQHAADAPGAEPWVSDPHWDPAQHDTAAADTGLADTDPGDADPGDAVAWAGYPDLPDEPLQHGPDLGDTGLDGGHDDIGDLIPGDPGHGDLGHIGADPDAAAEADPSAEAVFPPAVHVGDLPEPVDGFPWIDTGTLGIVGLDTAEATAGTADTADLAAYAEVDLPPGVDPWAVLAASDDPATSALARFWAPEDRAPGT